MNTLFGSPAPASQAHPETSVALSRLPAGTERCDPDGNTWRKSRTGFWQIPGDHSRRCLTDWALARMLTSALVFCLALVTAAQAKDNSDKCSPLGIPGDPAPYIGCCDSGPIYSDTDPLRVVVSSRRARWGRPLDAAHIWHVLVFTARFAEFPEYAADGDPR